MREIKFRLVYINKLTKKYAFSEWTLDDILKAEHIGSIYEQNYMQWQLIDKLEFTGLKDKNGKEIYEGDIIFNDDRKHDNKAVVGYRNCGYVCRYSKHEFYPLDNTLGNLYYKIGNIYENPELLKDK